ncbi:hypothetical protein [Aureibacillus halotolerans]|nr:hypothetical protein [Aureibacillus halotolerans]
MLTFAVFFLYVFITFLYAFYIDPFFGLTEYFNPDMTVAEMEKDRLERHTFTQLLVYGDFIYGVLYSTWVGVNAAVWSSFGFLLLLVMNRSYVALTIPYLAYLAQVFFFGNPTLQPYRFSFSVFPYGFTQQEIWTAFIPLGALVIICLALSLYVRLKFRTLDNFL